MGWPIGTPEEVAAVRLNPEQVETCSPAGRTLVHEGEMERQKGCQFWKREGLNGEIIECLFARDCPTLKNRPQVKAFRGHGPKNVRVFIRLDKAEVLPGQLLPAAFSREMPCFIFESTMRNRYDNQGKTGEVVAIMGVEGDGQMFTEIDYEAIENPSDPRGPRIRVPKKVVKALTSFPRPAERYGELEMVQQVTEAISQEAEREIAESFQDHVAQAMASVETPKYQVTQEAKPKK